MIHCKTFAYMFGLSVFCRLLNVFATFCLPRMLLVITHLLFTDFPVCVFTSLSIRWRPV